VTIFNTKSHVSCVEKFRIVTSFTKLVGGRDSFIYSMRFIILISLACEEMKLVTEVWYNYLVWWYIFWVCGQTDYIDSAGIRWYGDGFKSPLLYSEVSYSL